MISTRTKFKIKVFEHRCCDCGLTWEDEYETGPIGGCPECSQKEIERLKSIIEKLKEERISKT